MKRWTGVVAAGLIPAVACAGWFGGGSEKPPAQQGPGPEMAALMKQHSCTADMEMEIQPKKGKAQTMRGAYAVLEGKTRMEMDMSRMEGVDADSAQSMKEMGMDKVVTVVLPEKQTTLMIYPGMKAYCEMTTAPGKGKEKAAEAAKIDRKEIGKEKVDGHPCVKYLVTVTLADGKKHEMTTWEATDLKNFPIQTQMNQDGSTVTSRFKNVKMGKPDAKLFEAPEGFKKHDSVQSMMMGAAMKGMGGFGR